MRALFALLLVAVAAPAAALDRTPAQARDVVARYYAALDRGAYRTAYMLWDRSGQASGQSYAGFVRGFARTAHTRVVTGAPTDMEGAAGSSYITVPVRVYATLKNGAAQRFTGTYTLRRVNDVPGATPAQLSWHLSAAKLRQAR
ncbi:MULTISPECIES: hypothetical protein [unclassified Sphingomonas]|jgi:hypothetical protein|uniref:hypothetical protein n=1 Tax=unclassified Sphingomonas TaxID=196159 RepID=UPI000E10042E|nr:MULTISPECIES: hypothetical protein [unclassified Sphingomonas]AXJ95600.1 hypothetical protein DM480_08840 [Sphingomonas sp. FARSPH]